MNFMQTFRRRRSIFCTFDAAHFMLTRFATISYKNNLRIKGTEIGPSTRSGEGRIGHSTRSGVGRIGPSTRSGEGRIVHSTRRGEGRIVLSTQSGEGRKRAFHPGSTNKKAGLANKKAGLATGSLLWLGYQDSNLNRQNQNL